MNRYNLVVLKNNNPFMKGDTLLSPYVYYRCLTPTENDNDSYMIYAEWFSQEEFDNLFEFAYDRIMREWETFGLVVAGKKLAYGAFKKKANVVKYSQHGRKPLHICYFHSERDIYGFYPWCRDTKEGSLKWAYENYVRTFEGDMLPFDHKNIQFGNWGTPIAFSNLRTLW